MKKKVIIILTLIYGVQFLASCCGDQGTFEVTYTGVQGSTLSLVNGVYEDIPANVSISKTDLAIEISLESEAKEIASLVEGFSSFGFGSVMATTCPDPEYIYLESISSIEIIAINTGTNERIDVTNNFRTNGINNDLVTIEDQLNVFERQDGFRFYLTDEQGIPDNVEFVVNVNLDSNVVHSYLTNQISFN